MPIRQPVQTTIHTDDFRDKAYGFIVESMLMPQEHAGTLTVSTSAGYLLRTPLGKELRREQTIEHVLQDDGSWLATENVTLIVADDSPVNGQIIIRNSLAETVVLTVDVTSTVLENLQEPVLTVSQQTLSFAHASPGKPSFLVFTVAQQHSELPVTLTTDAPEHFRLASDSRPAFLPTLTLTPSSIGTYVHVQYLASKNGLHTGQLTIQTSYDQKTVALQGRSSGLLPAIRRPRPASGRAMLPPPGGRQPVAKRWIGVVAMVIVSGLAYAGYANRCQLVPALCYEAETSQPSTVVAHTAPVDEVVLNTAIVKSTNSQTVKDKVKKPSSRASRLLTEDAPAQQNRVNESTNERNAETDIRRPLENRKSAKQKDDNQLDSKTNRRVTPAQTPEESELERALNQKF